MSTGSWIWVVGEDSLYSGALWADIQWLGPGQELRVDKIS